MKKQNEFTEAAVRTVANFFHNGHSLIPDQYEDALFAVMAGKATKREKKNYRKIHSLIRALKHVKKDYDKHGCPAGYIGWQ